MRIEKADRAQAKGWYCGPWDSELEISLGYANQGVDEPHPHLRMRDPFYGPRRSARGWVWPVLVRFDNSFLSW